MSLEWSLYVLKKKCKRYDINVYVNVYLTHFLSHFSGTVVVVIV